MLFYVHNVKGIIFAVPGFKILEYQLVKIQFKKTSLALPALVLDSFTKYNNT